MGAESVDYTVAGKHIVLFLKMQVRSGSSEVLCYDDSNWIIIASAIFFWLLSALGFSFGSPQLSIPTIGSDQLIYACADNEVVALWGNGTLAWSAVMNQTCQTGVAPVIDYEGRVYAAADQTVVVVTPPSSESTQPSAADFFSMVPAISLKSIGNFSSITGLAVTSWSSVLYINTGTGIHAFLLDGTPLWSTLVQFKDSVMKSPESMGSCSQNVTDCIFFPSLAVDQCDGSIYVARSDGWLYSYATWQPFLRWRYAFTVDVPSSVKVISGNNGRVYAAMANYDMVYALSSNLGTLIWQVKVGPLGETSCIPVVDLSGFVSIGSLDGFLYVISPDGTQINKYLADDISSPVSIQTSPILDCSDEAIYVAQTRVKSKAIQQVDGTKVVSFTQSWGMNIWMLVPSSGQVLWSTLYPDLFPAAILLRDLSSFNIDSDWLIALTAAANLSSKSLCRTQQKLHQTSCSQFLFTTTKIQYPGNNRQIIAFSISILVIFLLLSILSMLLYCYWRKRQAVHTYRLCQLLKQERFRHPQVLLLKRRRAYEQTIEYMQAKLDLEPGSPKILEQLKAALEGLHFINRCLALFPSDAVLDDDDHQDRLLRDPAPLPESASSSTQTGTPVCSLTVLLNSVLQRMFGPPEQEDLAKEMRLLSSYNDWPPTTPGIESFAEGVRSQMQKNKFRAQQSLCIWETLFNQSNTKYSNSSPDQISTGEYRNPLYNQGRTLDPIPTRKRIVTFSPVDEVFEGSDQHSSCAFDDASAISVHSTTELVTHSTALVCDEILAEDMRCDN